MDDLRMNETFVWHGTCDLGRRVTTLDLLSLCDVNDTLSSAVEMVMKQRIARKKIIYRKNYIDEYKTLDFKETDHYVEISDLPTISRMLKCCRHLIENFEIRNAFAIPSAYRKMPLLNELSYSNYDKSQTYSAIGLIKNNLQIRKFTLQFATAYLLQIIANELKQLESITLTNYQYRLYDSGIFNFHFEHVRSFKMSGFTNQLPSGITFDRLEVFDIDEWDGTDFTEIIKLVLDNKMTLKRLRLNIGLLDSEIFEIANANMRLTEISFKYRESIPFKGLSKFTDDAHLMKIEIHLPCKRNSRGANWEQLTVADLHSRFQHRWNITQVDQSCFQLTRTEDGVFS